MVRYYKLNGFGVDLTGMKENEEITKNLELGGSCDLMDMHQKAGSSVYLLYTDERGGKLANQGRQSLSIPPEPDLGKSIGVGHWGGGPWHVSLSLF